MITVKSADGLPVHGGSTGGVFFIGRDGQTGGLFVYLAKLDGIKAIAAVPKI